MNCSSNCGQQDYLWERGLKEIGSKKGTTMTRVAQSKQSASVPNKKEANNRRFFKQSRLSIVLCSLNVFGGFYKVRLVLAVSKGYKQGGISAVISG